jgi:hypothetical protein
MRQDILVCGFCDEAWSPLLRQGTTYLAPAVDGSPERLPHFEAGRRITDRLLSCKLTCCGSPSSIAWGYGRANYCENLDAGARG